MSENTWQLILSVQLLRDEYERARERNRLLVAQRRAELCEILELLDRAAADCQQAKMEILETLGELDRFLSRQSDGSP